MKIEYKRFEEPKKTNCFEVIFGYEHGDADSNSSNTIVLKDITEEDLIGYIQKAEDIAGMIDENRSYGKKLPKDLETQAKFKDMYIPIEWDDYAKMHTSDYYAAMGVEDIFYYNADGIKHKVTITK
jgi:hypothetical protein